MRKGFWIFLAMVSSTFGEVSNLRLLALGERPVINPGLGLAGAPVVPNLVPPVQVAVKNAQGAFEEIELRLKVCSEPIVVSGGAVEIPVFEGARRGGKEWANLEIPGTGNYLGLLVRSQKPKKPSWEKVDAFVLKNDGKSFPEGAMRIFNASSSNIALKIGKQKALMIPAKGSLLEKQLQVPVLLRIAKREEDGAFKMLYANQARELKEGERLSVFVYEDKEARQGLKVFLSYDLAPKEN